MDTHQGSCHCGNISFEMTTDLAYTLVCNCSFCVRRNAVLHGVSAENFRVLKGDAGEPKGARTYGSGIFLHHFCPQCGIQCFTRVDSNRGPRVNVNMGCFDPAQ